MRTNIHIQYNEYIDISSYEKKSFILQTDCLAKFTYCSAAVAIA